VKRTRITRTVQAALLAALLVGMGSLACGNADPQDSNNPAVSAGPVEADPSAASASERVTTARVRKGAITALVTASGSIAACRSTPLGPAVPGRILRVFVKVGDTVAEGDPIFLIDEEPYRIALEEARAGLALARAELAQAQQEAERARKLAQKKTVSEQAYDRAQTGATVARAHVAQAKSQVARMENNLERTQVRAPYAGSIVDRLADEGTMATVTPNTIVVVLQETNALEAVLDIPEASLAVVRVGDTARLHVEGVAEPFESTVQVVSDRIDLASRTYEVRVPVTDVDRRLKAGAFVRGEIEPSMKDAVLLVDRSALITLDGRTYAFRVSDGRAERVPVRLGVVGEGDAEVLSGLAEGDEVVVGRIVARLADGAQVQTGPSREPDVANRPPSAAPPPEGGDE
jgi:RND family efflux transporter MFP subunit